MTETKCARCGQPAQGYATIGNERYCHGDQDQPTCYMRETWERMLPPAEREPFSKMIDRIQNPPRWERWTMAFGGAINGLVGPAARWLIRVFGHRALWVLGVVFVAWMVYLFTVPVDGGWLSFVRVVFGMWMGGLFGHTVFLTLLMMLGRRQLQDLPEVGGDDGG